MSTERLGFDPRELTFAQREGAAPLPRQLELKEVSQELRSTLWVLFYSYLKDAYEYSQYGKNKIRRPWRELFMRWHVNHLHGMIDEFDQSHDCCLALVKWIIEKGDYIKLFTFLEFVARDPAATDDACNAGS